MRAITRDAIEAFGWGEPFSRDNTRVAVHGECVTLLLHDNAIARRDGSSLIIRTAGWPTTTTKERLNGLPGVSVSTSKGVLYLNGKAWEDHEDWTTIKD